MGVVVGSGAKLGELERAIMQVLWAAGEPVTAREIGDALVGRELAKTTVLTVLGRLEKKGRVVRCRDDWAHTYQAAATREEYVAQLMHDALGDASDRTAALARFVDQVSDDEAQALREALDLQPRESENAVGSKHRESSHHVLAAGLRPAPGV